MPSVTKYPGTITQNTGTTVVSYSNLNNLKNNNATYATTALIGTKNDTKKNPPTIKCTNFGFNLPNGSEVTKITVEYAHQRTAYNSNYASIGKNTIQIVGAGLGKYGVLEHASPPKTLTAKTANFNGTYTYPTVTIGGTSITLPTTGSTSNSQKALTSSSKTEKYTLPDIGKINSTDFGVSIDYPPNTGANKGYLRLKYIRITITYKITEYALNINKITAGDVTVGTPSTFDITLNNLNATEYSPTVTITIPSGTDVHSHRQDGALYKTNNTTLTWKPGKLKDIGTVTCSLRLLCTEGSGKTITATEALTNATTSKTFTVYPTPTGIIDEEPISEQTVYCYENFPKTINITIPEAWKSETDTIYIQPDTYVTYEGQGETIIPIPVSSFDENNSFEFTFTVEPESLITILSVAPNSTDINNSYYIKAIPSYAKPYMNIIPLTSDELDRLGDDYTYKISSYFKLNGNISNTLADNYRNYRLGVVNNTEATDPVNIFEACDNWSGPMTVYNSWEEKTVEFTYNENYPVYILITGEFNLDDTFTLDFSEISITEIDSVEGFSEGIYIPEPINNILIDGETSDLTLPAYTSSNKLIAYDLPFGEDFGTNDDYAIHGIQLQLNIETINNITCNATLHGPNGETGSESIVIDPTNSEYTIGGPYDLFGLQIGDMTDLQEWEVELSFSNNTEEEIDIIVNTLQVTASFISTTHSNETIIVDGENLGWYNAFIENVKIPMGLETETKYVNVNGTDVNEALLMSVRGKEISVELSVDGCDLTETTEMINQLMKLLTNERDTLNRPIPKTVEFSFMPEAYFEYIKEDASDSSISISNYELTIKLQIPSGTSFSKNETVTGASGVVDSITKINPVINITPHSDTVEILETYTGQQFNMGNTEWIGKYVSIDCENRTVTVRDEEDDEPTDISYSADMNNDWFILNGAFIFECTGCTLQNVTWTNRS